MGSKNVPSSRLPPRTSSAPPAVASATCRSTLSTARVVDQRADLDAVLEAVPDLQRTDGGVEARDELVVDGVLHEDPVGRDAGLAGVAELARDRALDRGVEICVVEDEERGVAAELERDLLHGAGALRHQELSDLGRPGEGELADGRVRRQLAADHRRVLCVAGDDLEHALWNTGLLGELDERERRERRLLGRLDHDRAADGERRRRLARDHRGGEVPRRDPGGDADRLAQHHDPPVGLLRGNRVAVDALRLLAEPLEERGRVGDLGARLGERLALLAGEQPRELVLPLQHQVREAAQDQRSLLGGARTPRRLRALGRGDRAARLLDAVPRHLR